MTKQRCAQARDEKATPGSPPAWPERIDCGRTDLLR